MDCFAIFSDKKSWIGAFNIKPKRSRIHIKLTWNRCKSKTSFLLEILRLFFWFLFPCLCLLIINNFGLYSVSLVFAIFVNQNSLNCCENVVQTSKARSFRNWYEIIQQNTGIMNPFVCSIMFEIFACIVPSFSFEDFFSLPNRFGRIELYSARTDRKQRFLLLNQRSGNHITDSGDFIKNEGVRRKTKPFRKLHKRRLCGSWIGLANNQKGLISLVCRPKFAVFCLSKIFFNSFIFCLSCSFIWLATADEGGRIN